MIAPTISHTFSFETVDDQKNITHTSSMVIVNENDLKYSVDYIQYIHSDIDLDEADRRYRRKLIRVDKLYFLELANITINDQQRYERLFSIFGRRRFGANDKSIDYYLLNEKLNEEDVLAGFERYKQKHKLQSFYLKSLEHSENHYKFVSFKSSEGCFVVLHQRNVSPRKTHTKYFFIELSAVDFSYWSHLKSNQHRVDYCFYKIGEIYFSSLPLLCFSQEEESVPKAKASKKSVLREPLFELDRDKRARVAQAADTLYHQSSQMLEDLSSQNIENFYKACSAFVLSIKGIPSFTLLSSYMTTLKSIVHEGKLSYLMEKNDMDIHDILIYTLEVFAYWSGLLHKKDTDREVIERQSIDLNDALKYLIDSYLKFNHDYHLDDAKQQFESQTEQPEDQEASKISAEIFLKEHSVDSELIEELNEQEHELKDITSFTSFDSDIRDTIQQFVRAYIRMFNQFFEFQDVAYSLNLLMIKLENCDFDVNKQKLSAPLMSLLSKLMLWKQDVLLAQSAESIHYLDNEFYLYISEIENLIEDEKLKKQAKLELL